MSIESIQLDSLTQPKQNHVIGAELLMNSHSSLYGNQSTSSSRSHDIHLEDLEQLEKNLNDSVAPTQEPSLLDPGMFSSTPIIKEYTPSLQPPPTQSMSPAPNIVTFEPPGQSSFSDFTNSAHTNEYKFNDVPIVDSSKLSESNNDQHQSPQEVIAEKYKYLQRFKYLEQKGIELSEKYTINSSLLDMKCEYDVIVAEKEKQNSIKFQGNILFGFVKGLEYLSKSTDIFDINLDGFSDQVSDSITDYDDIFTELHEKYRSKVQFLPELKLLYMLGGSAAMVHITNNMFKSSPPGVEELMKQNPELSRQFQYAAMNAQQPGMFQSPRGPPPPPQQMPIPVHELYTEPVSSIRAGNNDYGMAEQPQHANDYGLPEYIQKPKQQQQQSPQLTKTVAMERKEMKGPSEIDFDVLAGLKTKKTPVMATETPTESTISVSDLINSSKTPMPKKKRQSKQSKQQKTTISLDI